ncbi:hypothetical protein [Streptomyces bauhiniae]
MSGQYLVRAGSWAAEDNSDGTEAKDLSHPEWRKSRSTFFRLG